MRKLIALFIAFQLVARAGAQRPRPNPRVQPGPSVVAGRSYDGDELTVDLPASEQMENIGSFLDDAGMCVFTSIEMAARYCGIESFRGFRDWCAHTYNGGGDPDNVVEHIAAYCRFKGIPVPPYKQYEGTDPGPILAKLDSTGRPACITYGQSPRYVSGRNPTGTVAHMTCCIGFHGKWE